MPANSTGEFWAPLAVVTGRIGHLYSPGGQRGPRHYFPYALDAATYPLVFGKKGKPPTLPFLEGWAQVEPQWKRLLFWAQAAPQKPLWAIVPDWPTKWDETCLQWSRYASIVAQCGFPLAVAVQNGATPESVRSLSPKPDVIAIGGDDEWKWGTLEMWVKEFRRIHVLRCNAPSKLDYLEEIGVESCDGTGWSRGNRTQTEGLERWARRMSPRFANSAGLAITEGYPLFQYVCRGERKAFRQMKGQPVQEAFA